MKASTESIPKTQDWRKEYFDSLDLLERERQQFGALEAVLKRVAGRLCTASSGQSAQLDKQIKALQTSMRRESTCDELDRIASALTNAIADIGSPAVIPAAAAPPLAAPAPAQPSHTAAPAIDDRLRAVLSALLTELRRDSELIIVADAVDSSLAAALTRDQLSDAMSSIAELVTRRIRRIEHTKQEIETVLSHMVGRLDEIGRFVTDSSNDQTQLLASRESLSTQLIGEMKAMGESVAAAVHVDQIRAQVRNRLDSIGQHLLRFRERETNRTNEMHARNEQMRTRVAELEAKAKTLHDQLHDEQRLSTIDTLTNIPNRLAYEKRIEEEINRWKRFKQPTCIAVWDIDLFKAINDKYGHRAGDRVLRAVAESLATGIRTTDFLARFGGEEFVTIFCGTKIDDAARVIDNMRIGISELKFHIRGTPLPPVTISIGVTAFLPNDTAGAAFDRADKALYQAKGEGRNRRVSG